MPSEPLKSVCVDCNEPITLYDGLWCDETIKFAIAAPSTAALCETGGIHRPDPFHTGIPHE